MISEKMDSFRITYEDVEKIRPLCVTFMEKQLSLGDFPSLKGVLKVDNVMPKQSFAVYFDFLKMEFSMFITNISSVVPSMEFNVIGEDMVFKGLSKNYWDNNPKGEQQAFLYFSWVLATMTYLSHPDLSKDKVKVIIQ